MKRRDKEKTYMRLETVKELIDTVFMELNFKAKSVDYYNGVADFQLKLLEELKQERRYISAG